MKLNELLITPNIISLSRFIISVLAAIILLNGYYIETIVLLILAWVTDLLDGYIARKGNIITETGKIIDPLADKFSIVLISIVLLLIDILPLWFFLIILLRDLLILSGALYLKYKKKVVLMSDWTGKIAVFLIGLSIINFIIFQLFIKTFSHKVNLINILELFNNVLIFITLVMITFSLFKYYLRFKKNIKSLGR